MGNSPQTPYTRLDSTLRSVLVQIFSMVDGQGHDLVGINVKKRGEQDWIVVIKAYGADGGPIVCFGNGFDISGGLLAAEGAVAAERWREDKPWQPG